MRYNLSMVKLITKEVSYSSTCDFCKETIYSETISDVDQFLATHSECPV